MERCKPVEMRKNLEIVDTFKRNGIDFVAIPAMNNAHKNKLIEQGRKVFDDMVKNEEEAELLKDLER